jgi:hypothetical protein
MALIPSPKLKIISSNVALKCVHCGEMQIT